MRGSRRTRGPGRVSVLARKKRLLKEKILESAESLMVTHGAQALTLDNVLREADLAAEDMLLVFPGKEALLDALVQRYLQVVAMKERAIAGRLVDGSDGKILNSEVRASIIRLLTDDPGADEVGVALLAASSTDSNALDRVKEALRLRFESFRSSSTGYGMTSAIQLAVIGITVLEMLKVFPLPDAERQRVIRFLFQLASAEQANDQ